MTINNALWRWPAEFEPHAATALTWPNNPQTWHQGLAAPRGALALAIRTLLRGESVHLHVQSAEQGREARELIGAHERLFTHVVPSNDAWCRDHGAIVVYDEQGQRVALDFQYNAWGGKYPPWDLDARVAAAMASYLHLPLESSAMVLEGGAIDGNGQGIVMTTASCVLDAKRNQSVALADIESVFGRLLGCRHVLWLEGEIPGDDTDGHVDNLARFVSPTRALVVAPERPTTPWQRALAENPRRLARQCERLGLDIELRTLPIPDAFQRATDLPASYANFLIANDAVLMPVYSDPADDRACAIVDDCFANRELVPIDCTDLIVGLGALHCLTQQIPAPIAHLTRLSND